MGIFLRASFGMIAVGLIAGQAPVDSVSTPGVQRTPDGRKIDPLPAEQLIDPLPLGPPPSTPAEPRILNDTPEYCDALRADIAKIRTQRGEISAHAAMLTREGERMCRIGHIKPGIYRLRSALMILRGKVQAPE